MGDRGVYNFPLMTFSYMCSFREKMCLDPSLKLGVFEICVGLLELDNERVRRNTKALMVETYSFTN